MNHKPVTDLLAKLGLNQLDIIVYIFLAKKGPYKGREICSEIKIGKQKLYPCLQNLKRRGVVNASQSRPATFYATPFEEILDQSIKSILDEAQTAGERKTELLDTWKSMIAKDTIE